MTPHSRFRTLRTAVVAAVVATLVAATAAAGAATGPWFTTADPLSGLRNVGVSYPVSVSGTFVPLAMDCLGEKRVLWYSPGAAADALWRNVTFPATGSPAFTSTAVSITGTYQPFTGDFDGDGCEDVFWYAPGAAVDPVWFFAADGTHTSVAKTVGGSYQAVVGSFDGAAPDDIYWFGGAADTETIWTGSAVRGAFSATAAPQFAFDAQAVSAITPSSIYFDAAGTVNDRLYDTVAAGVSSPGAVTPVPSPDGGATWRSLAGLALRYVPGAGADAVVTRVGSTFVVCKVGTPCPPPTYKFAPTPVAISGTYVVSSSTARAGFGIFHAPGTAPDSFVVPRQTGVYFRQPAATTGARPNGSTVPHAISADGTKVALKSSASNLVAGDTNDVSDVFVWDRSTGTYRRQPNGVGGAQPNGLSQPMAMSADGSVVVLASVATNLVPGDTNNQTDLFVWDLTTNTYQRQPNGVGGVQANGSSLATAVSGDGTRIALFSSATNLVPGDTNGVADAFVWDRTTGTYLRQPNGVGGAAPNQSSIADGISADGTKVVLISLSSNLVSGDTNGVADAFIWNLTTGTYTRQPNGVGGAQPDGSTVVDGVSADGSRVLLTSAASNLVTFDTNGSTRDVFIWNVATGTYTRGPLGADRTRTTVDVLGVGMSADGTKVALSSEAPNLVSGDTNGVADAFIWDVSTGSVVRQPLRVDLRQPAKRSFPGNAEFPNFHGAAMSADGTQLAIAANDTLLTGGPANPSVTGFETFVWDRTPG